MGGSSLMGICKIEYITSGVIVSMLLRLSITSTAFLPWVKNKEDLNFDV